MRWAYFVSLLNKSLSAVLIMEITFLPYPTDMIDRWGTHSHFRFFKSSYDSHFALSSEHFHVSGMSCQESGFELKHCFWSVCLLLESALRAPNHTMRVFLTSRLFRVFFSKTPCNAYQVSVENQVLICFIEKTAKNRHM